MGRIIAIANQKGGVGKTTTTINLAAALAEKGKKVLVVDTDPQGNTTSGFGLDRSQIDNTVYQLMIDECKVEEAIIKDVLEDLPGLDILPANVDLAAVEVELMDVEDKEFILQKALGVRLLEKV